MAPNMMPSPQAATPRTMLAPANTPTTDKPNTASMNNSAVENIRMTGLATNTNPVSTTAPNTPPKSDEVKAALSARAACPFLASG